MLIPSILELQGTLSQQAVVATAIARSNFPWDILLPGLQAKTGRTKIPCDWMDLSRWNASHADANGLPHAHGDEAHTIEREIDERQRVLGLAWYAGRVTLDLSLEHNPELAGEVFLSEAAHMADFFYMTDEHRRRIWNAFHPNDPPIQPGQSFGDGVHIGHNHSWFDVGSYRSWVGEAFMGAFTKAYSDFPVTIPFDHPVSPDVIRTTQDTLTPGLFVPVPPVPPAVEPDVPEAEPIPNPPEDEPEAPAPDVPAPKPGAPYYAGKSSRKIFHDSHKRIAPVRTFDSFQDALDAGFRPCKTCDPKP